MDQSTIIKIIMEINTLFIKTLVTLTDIVDKHIRRLGEIMREFNEELEKVKKMIQEK